MQNRSIVEIRMLVSAALLAAALACGSDAPEQQLAQAREQLVEARGEVEALEAKVERRREAVRLAEEALAKVRAEFEVAERELAQARATIDERATRVALFRAVQAALLENEALEAFAIRVEVEGDVVKLHGTVDQQTQVDEAVATARAVAGVESVVSRIRIRGSESTGV